MKKIFVFLMALLPAMAFAQTPTDTTGNFIIQAKIGNLNSPARAYLFYQLGANKVVDSSLIVNGVFSFHGDVIDPNRATMVIDHTGRGISSLDPKTADALPFILAKENIALSSVTDSVYRAKLTGSAINEDYQKFIAVLAPVNAMAQQFKATVNSMTPEQQEAKSKELQKIQINVLQNYVNANPKSYFSIIAISQLGQAGIDVSVLAPLYAKLDTSLKSTETGKQLKKSINALLPTALGAMAPDFTQNDPNGNPVSLSSFKGKYVLIDFWASWCGPCREENPNVVKAYNKFKNKNFTILGVSLDKPEGKADWLAAIKNDGLTWTQVSDLRYWGNKVALLYAVQSIPHNFLLDPSGKIIAKDLRGSDLDAKLTQIFGNM
jgi:peroxiredoxin